MTREWASHESSPPIRVRRPGSDAFASVLGDAIAARGLTLRSLQRRLEARGVAVGTSTLSYWRSGQRQPEGAASLDAVGHLEDILDVPPGHLVSRIGPSRRPGPPPRRIQFTDLVGATARERRLLREHGFDHDDDLVPLSIHVTVDVSTERAISAVRMRSVVRATVEGARDIPIVLRLERPTSSLVTFRSTGGGQLTGPVRAISPDLQATAFRLARPLRLGETAVYEYEMTLADALDFHFYEEYLLRRTGEVLLWIRFTDGVTPAACTAYQRGEDSATEAPIDLAGSTCTHVNVRGFGPGTVGIRWEW